MAKQTNNVVTHGLSGKIGDLLIFRQWNGKTIVSSVPRQPKTVSDKQKQQRERFQNAVLYAQSAVAAEGLKEQYAAGAQKGKSAFNIAVADFLTAPDIRQIDLSEYTGQPGGKIHITISDDFAVTTVSVSITNADGTLVEKGEALRGLGNLWTYTATQENQSLEGDKIEIIASDLPGNQTKAEQTL